uniref:Calcium-binding protein n=1 Tax=Rhodosorus marinus TaxID=101924 RepID=A0A7S0BF40_9RHOD|mmetsp:Transcript_13169/g.18975  ORF Transcript_13169/g.18975 Transcript_13169/m.18975 type:complete len:335 (+) Transcript_13169:147-1151(+)
MRFALVVAVVGSLYLVRGEVFADTCANFVLPPPDELNAVGDPNVAEKRVLWGESYCKELTLKDLGGKTPKLCVRNENPKDKAPTGCLRLSLRHIDPALIKELRVAIHPDCGGIPTENKDKFQRRRNRAKLAVGKEMNAIRICFDDIPATSTCCGTEQCLVFEAVVEVEGVDTEVVIKDDTCISEEGCSYSIGCPNLISERNCDCDENIFLGTDSNDLFIIPEGEAEISQIIPFKGDDVVIGSENADGVSNSFDGGGTTTAFLKGGDDIVTLGNGVLEKLYLGRGDDLVYDFFEGADGLPDLIYGGGGWNLFRGELDDEDILKNIFLYDDTNPDP